jgi:hypothetical protein
MLALGPLQRSTCLPSLTSRLPSSLTPVDHALVSFLVSFTYVRARSA